MVTFRLETVIAAPPEECFALSLSVDAHTASMSGSAERIVGGVTAGEMRAGETVTWRAMHFGIPWRLTSRISEYAAPHRFVDEQLSGPFAAWRHEHRFEAIVGTAAARRPEAGPARLATRMIDLVEFAAPLGPLGRLAERLVLRRYLERLLERRNRWLAEQLERA